MSDFLEGLRANDPEVRRRLWRILAVVVGLIVLWLGFQAVQASMALNRASSQVAALKLHLAAGETKAAQTTLTNLQKSTSTARDNSDGPLWAVAGWVPVLGNNAQALTTISSVLDDVSGTALPPLVNAAGEVKADTFTPKNGQVNIEAMEELRPALKSASQTLGDAKSRLTEIDPDDLLGRFRRPVVELKADVDTGASAAAAAHGAAELGPQMLAKSGKVRRYLLLIQTNAEVRSLGGIPGSWAIIEVKNGKLKMTEQGAAHDVGIARSPALPMTEDEQSVYSDRLVHDFRDTTFTPDFPRAAELSRAMLRRGTGVRVHGVISVDPVALSYIMEGTGPVSVDGATLDRRNAVHLLLSRSYIALDHVAQDDFFEATARVVFDAVTEGKGDAPTLLRAFVRAAAENRVMLWSAYGEEQKRLAKTGIGGVLPSDEGETPHVGVYLNDSTEAKLQYYLDFTTRATATSCTDDKQSLEVTAQLSSAAPPNVDELPQSVLGRARLAPKGSMRTNVRIYGPHGGVFTGVWVNRKRQSVYTAKHHGRPVTFVSLLLAPGDRFTVRATMETATGQIGDGILAHTPGVQSRPNDVPFPSAC